MFPDLLVEMGFGSNPGTAQASIVWTDVTAFAHWAQIRRGRSSELDEFQAGSCTLELDNSDRRFDPSFTGTDSYLNLPGVNGANASCPDAAGLDVTGDFSVRALVLPEPDWTPAVSYVVSKNGGGAAGGYFWRLGTDGRPVVGWSDGTNPFTETADLDAPVVAGVPKWFWITLDADDGAGNRVITFRHSDDAQSWTTYDTDTVAGTTTGPAANATGLFVGSFSNGGSPWAGRIYKVEVAANLAHTDIRASPDFRKLPQGTTSFTDTQGNVWTLNGTASLVYNQSPYAPNVKPMVPVRVSATHNAVTHRLFTGFVAGFPQDYNPPNYARCTVECVDGFEVLRQAELPESVWVAKADGPGTEGNLLLRWWRFGETAGLTAAGHTISFGFPDPRADGEWVNTAGAPGVASLLPYSTDGAAQFDGTAHLELPAPPSQIVEAPEFVFSSTATTGTLFDIQSFFTTRSVIQLRSGKLRITFSNNTARETDATVNDGIPHHVVITGTVASATKIYVDGVEVASSLVGSPTFYPSNQGPPLIFVGSLLDWSDGLVGVIDEFRARDFLASVTSPAVWYGDMTAPWDGDSTGNRLGRLLDAISWPAADRDIDAGISVLGPARLGTDALSAAKAVEKVEAGRLYMGRDGKVVFRDRHHTILNTTVVATFGETGSAGEFPYFFEGFRYKFDRDLVRNSVSANREGGPTLTVEDATSITANLKRSHPLGELLNVSDNEVRGRVEWTLDHYKDPLLRIESIVIRPQSTPGSGDTWTSNGLWAAVLGLDVTQRHVVKRLPQNVGAAISTTVICEGVEHDIGPQEWTTSVYFSPADTRHYFILNTDELDDPLARLAY